MKSKLRFPEECIYDIPYINSVASKRTLRTALIMAVCAVTLILSVLLIALYGTQLVSFIVGAVLFCLSAYLLIKQWKNIKSVNYREVYGEIVDVHKDVVSVRHITGRDINPFGLRRFDTYRSNETRITVYIKEADGNVFPYYLRRVTEEHVEYYEKGGIAIHVSGACFPVIAQYQNSRWLCPLCGGFNPEGEMECAHCGKGVIK